MQGIESAIRNALTKADSSDPAMRQRIYKSVWSAHERAMAANMQLSDQQRAERREKLKTAISQVEQEIRQPVSPASVEQPASEAYYDGGLGVPELDRAEVRTKNEPSRKRRNQTQAEPDLGYEPDITQPATHKKPKKSRLFSLGLPLAFLLTAGFIGWSLYNSFVMVAPVSSNSRVLPGNIGPVMQGNEADSKDWITIFTPAQPNRVSVQGQATAEISGSGNARYVRIKSPTANDTASFDIGQGVLDQIKGKQATFEVIVRSDDGGTVQMSVSCDLGSLGDCGRKRYDVTDQQSSLLFDLDVPEASTANSSGRLIVTSDITGAGKSVDIYAIRVKGTQ